MVELAVSGLPSWYLSQEVSSSNLGHVLIPLRVIPTYSSSYGGAYVAQTSEDGALTDT
jgi:hypothetical protein